MLRARRFPAAATALLLIASAFSAWLFPAGSARAESPSGSCEEAAQIAVLPSPLAPWKGAPLQVLVAAENPLQGELSLIAPDGSVAAKSSDPEGGPPYYWFAEVASPAAGTWRATLTLNGAPAGCGTITRDITVSAGKPPGLEGKPGSLWPIRASWNRATENLYSAWIAKLFDGPLDQELSWKTWVEVLHDRSRNMLFNYLGLGEDNLLKATRPDCADFVYFLRAYFAFKMGLPFGYSNCSRGNGGAPPKCYQWFDIEHPEVTRPAPPPEQATEQIAAAPEPAPEPNALQKLFAPPAPPAGAPACARAAEAACAEAAGACSVVRPIFAGGRRRRPNRSRARIGDRRPHRFLHGAADPSDAAPGHRLRRPLRTCSGAGQARGGSERCAGRLPRRRRGARRIGHAQALLARQFPVRARSGARQPRVQALPADRAREERRLAAADQCRNRQRPAIRRLLARANEAQRSGLLRSHG